MDSKYKVVYKGSLKKGIDTERFVSEFMRRLKAPERFARKLSAIGRTITLKGNLDALSAEKYRQVMDGLGMQVYVEAESVSHSYADAVRAEKFSDDELQVEQSEREHVCSQCGARHLMHGACLCGNIAKSESSASNRGIGYELKMGIARAFRVIFPPLNEITVFVIAVTLYSLFVYVDGFPSPAEVVGLLLKEMARQATESISNFIAMVVAAPILLAMIFGPLFLPFTRLDLSGTCGLVIAVFALVAAGTSIVNLVNDHHSLPNRLIFIYSISWIVYMYYILKFVKEPGFIMGAEQEDALCACIAATVSVVFVYVATNLYSVKWYNAFVIGTTSSSSIVPIIFKIVVAPLQKYARNQPGTNQAQDQPETDHG